MTTYVTRVITDTVSVHDTVRLMDTLLVARPGDWWRDAVPALGALAAVAAAFLTAYFAYRYNKRLFMYNIAYGSYQRALVRLQFLKRTLEEVREASIDN